MSIISGISNSSIALDRCKLSSSKSGSQTRWGTESHRFVLTKQTTTAQLKEPTYVEWVFVTRSTVETGPQIDKHRHTRSPEKIDHKSMCLYVCFCVRVRVPVSFMASYTPVNWIYYPRWLRVDADALSPGSPEPQHAYIRWYVGILHVNVRARVPGRKWSDKLRTTQKHRRGRMHYENKSVRDRARLASGCARARGH